MLLLSVIKPLGYDNSLVQSMALDMYRLGRVPYAGTWLHDLPGIVYFHYIGILLFGTSDLGFRIFDTLVQIAFALFFYRFLLRWLRPKHAALSALLYIAYYVSAGGLLLGERDVYGGMLIVLSASLLLSPSRAIWRIVLSGLLAGCYLTIRPTSLLYIGVIALWILWSHREEAMLSHFLRAILFAACGLAPLGAIILYYSHIPGALETMYLSVVRWNIDLYAPIDNGWLMPLLFEVGHQGLLIPFMIYGIVRFKSLRTLMRVPLSRDERGLYLALIASALFIAILMRKLFPYHFAPFFILVIPFIVLSIEHFIQRFHTERARKYALVAAVILCTFVTYPPKAPYAYFVGLFEHRSPSEAAYDAQFPDSLWGGRAQRAVLHYLDRPENRRSPIEICSFDPHLRQHLDRSFAGPYNVMVPIACRTNPESDAAPQFTTYQREWQRAYLDSLERRTPQFLIIARGAHYSYLDDPYASCLKWIPGFDSLLASSYQRDTIIAGYDIYRLQSKS